MADSLFDNNEFDENKDYLEELIGPGGKFDVARYGNRDEAIKAMAKGKALADRTLDHKNKEFDELREDYLTVRAENVAKAKFEEYLSTHERTSKTDDTARTSADNVEQPILDPSKIEDLVARKISEIESSRREKDNMDKVETRLRERFGSNAKSILRDKMNTLNISEDDVKFLAKKSPEAVFNALGLNEQPTETWNPVRSNTRSDSFTPQSDIRDAVYYEDLRRKDPKKYFDPKTSVQRLKDMDNPDFLKRYNSR